MTPRLLEKLYTRYLRLKGRLTQKGKLMDDIMTFVLQWGDSIVEFLNRIIAALEAFLKFEEPK